MSHETGALRDTHPTVGGGSLGGRGESRVVGRARFATPILRGRVDRLVKGERERRVGVALARPPWGVGWIAG
jgi:hypothetical protein